MASRRLKQVSAAETVQLVTEWLADKGIAANVVFKDGKEWAISGHHFPALPNVLRAIARECAERLPDESTH